MRTMMKMFVMMLVVAVVAPSALATFNAGDVRIWVYDSRDTGAGRTFIYRSNAWPVGGVTTMQTNTKIDSAPDILDPPGMTVFGQHVYMTTPTGNNKIIRYHYCPVRSRIIAIGYDRHLPGVSRISL